MARNITPLDENFQAPEAIPDRSGLVELYKSSKKEVRLEDDTSTDVRSIEPTAGRKVSFLGTVMINLLIVGPYVSSFLSIAAIYSIGSPTGIEDALENRISTMALTVPALLPWVFAIRILRDHLSDYRIGAFGLLTLYLFFILPVIDISLTLRENGVLDWVILLVTVIFSQLFIWGIAYVFDSSKKLVSTRMLPAICLLLPLICLAIFL